MPLSQSETCELLAGRVKVYRSVHRPHRRAPDARIVCAHCVAVWPCPDELWVRAVTRYAATGPAVAGRPVAGQGP